MKRMICLALALALAACAAPAPGAQTETAAPATAETAALTVGQLYTLPDTCGGYWAGTPATLIMNTPARASPTPWRRWP